MNLFLKSLGFTTLALFVVAATLTFVLPDMQLSFALAGISLMAFNAFAAVWVLRYRTWIEPIRLIFLSMAVRLAILAAIMFLAIRFVGHGASLYSFIFTGMAGYLVYQAVEIRHILRNPELMTK